MKPSDCWMRKNIIAASLFIYRLHNIFCYGEKSSFVGEVINRPLTRSKRPVYRIDGIKNKDGFLQQCQKNTGSHRRADNPGNIGTHRMHYQMVLWVCFQTNLVNNPCRHRYC